MNEALKPGVAKGFIKKLTPILKGDGPEHSFGWAIGTSDAELIQVNAADNGIEVSEAFWDQIMEDCQHLERNVMDIMRHIGMRLRDEGHSQDDLVGSGWLNEGGNAWRLWEDLSDQEIARSYDVLIDLFPDANDMMWKGVSENGQSLIDCDFRFLDPFPEPFGGEQEESARRRTARQLLDASEVKRQIMGMHADIAKMPGEARIFMPVQDREGSFGVGVYDEVVVPLGKFLLVKDKLWLNKVNERPEEVIWDSKDLYVLELISALKTLGFTEDEISWYEHR